MNVYTCERKIERINNWEKEGSEILRRIKKRKFTLTMKITFGVIMTPNIIFIGDGILLKFYQYS